MAISSEWWVGILEPVKCRVLLKMGVTSLDRLPPRVSLGDVKDEWADGAAWISAWPWGLHS